MKINYYLSLLFLFLTLIGCGKKQEEVVGVLVIGGGTSGVAAGIQSARMGVSTTILESGSWLGGMLTSAGVSAVDGNYNLRGGLWGEFVDSLVVHYGHLDSLKTGWVSNIQFEPSVGNRIFQNMAKRETKLNVEFNTVVKSVKKVDDIWEVNVITNNKAQTYLAKVLIDATELGDIAKSVGVEYSIGMDSRNDTGEDIAPEKANDIIQDLTYVAILKDYGKDMSIEKPANYDPSVFVCSHKNDKCVNAKEPNRLWDAHSMITYGKLPNNKYMINWPIEGNDYYVNAIEMTEQERQEAFDKAKEFTNCFVYYIQNEMGYKNLALADDEFTTTDLYPYIPYHRESRRIKGEVLFDVNHIMRPYDQKDPLYRTTVAVGDYPVDHHHTRYHGYQELPDLHFYPVPSYGLPLGTLIPKSVDGIVVAEKSISVTNLVNGTTRLQPVVLQIGQAAGILAALSVQQNKNIREVDVRQVQDQVLAANGYILPYLDVDVKDPNFKSYQRIGATGLLKGEGKNVDWSNQTWLRINDFLQYSELIALSSYYPQLEFPAVVNKGVSYGDLQSVFKQMLAKQILSDEKYKIFETQSEGKLDDFITRGHYALLVNQMLDPFHAKQVSLKGEFLN